MHLFLCLWTIGPSFCSLLLSGFSGWLLCNSLPGYGGLILPKCVLDIHMFQTLHLRKEKKCSQLILLYTVNKFINYLLSIFNSINSWFILFIKQKIYPNQPGSFLGGGVLCANKISPLISWTTWTPFLLCLAMTHWFIYLFFNLIISA